MTLDEQVKDAERKKFLAETEKIRAEQKQIELEYDKQLKETKKKWYSKQNYWKNLISILLGFSILGFYINYIILPISQKDNIELSLENSKHKKDLKDKEQRLKEDSIKLDVERVRNDSFNAVVLSKEIIIDSIEKTYKNLLLTIGLNKDPASNKINEAVHSAKKILQNLNMTQNSSTTKGATRNVIVNCTFEGGLGQCTLSVFSNGNLVNRKLVSSTSTINVELPAGLYVLVVNGFLTGQVTIDVKGNDITVNPSTPIRFDTGIFNSTMTIAIK